MALACYFSVKSLCSTIRKGKWQFDWIGEAKQADRNVFKLETVENPRTIHGLISLSSNRDHVFMHLIENSEFNVGAEKVYLGVAGNLIGYGCKWAFELGYEGILAFTAKPALIEHYEKVLKAKRFRGNNMYIDTPDSLSLVRRYF